MDKIQANVGAAITQAVGNDTGDDFVGSNFFSWTVRTGEIVPPWWSQTRDRALGALWKESNHLSIAVYNTIAKIVGIPPEIIPRNAQISSHVEEAEILQHNLFTTAGFGKGWEVEYSKFVESLITQDNGAFMEVIGRGNPAGPIIGSPISVRHLDTSRCTRTGDPIYPVVYTDKGGTKFKMHWTRIIYSSQMPSSISDMYGVGFCAVSRSVEIGQTLVDIIRYKQERLGSRPHNQILVGKGITGKQIMTALRSVEEDLSNRGFTKYARTVAIGSEDANIGLEKLDLNHMDPFDEEVSTNLAMFAISSAFGMDADELWPVGGKSAGKQEANIRRMRSRGRLPAQITSEIAAQFNYKVLPRHLKLEFDFKDDEEDMQRANIRDIRGRNRERDLGTGAVNIRGARVRMMKDGDIDRSTFTQMELSDGRLHDGTTIGVLFFSDDPVYEETLRFMPKPLSISENVFDTDGKDGTSTLNEARLTEVIGDIQDQRQLVLASLAMVTSSRQKEKYNEAFFALDWLEEQYNFAAGRILPPVPMQQRRLRQDIRVMPEEQSPEEGEQSPAQAASGISENVPTVGGE